MKITKPSDMPDIQANLVMKKNNTRLERIETETPKIVDQINRSLNCGFKDVYFQYVEWDDPRVGASSEHPSVWYESLDKAMDQFMIEGWHIEAKRLFDSLEITLYIKKPTPKSKILQFIKGIIG